MSYKTVYKDFIKLFPDDLHYFKEMEKENDVDEETPYYLFGMVVCPFLHKVVEEDEEKARLAFDFIEQMNSNEDDEIVNLAVVGILEIILTDENGGLSKFKKYFGPNTLKYAHRVSQFFDIKP
ncbi:MAG: hypothetical protein IKE59_00020 [Erysipelotrichaceae bacterium]|nr:hypothetical protein [Erysipelotrichaceae bacterium]